MWINKIVLMMGCLGLSACAAGYSQPVNSRCFDSRGELRCQLRPLPELWAEARQNAVEEVGYYEGAVEKTQGVVNADL